MSTRTADEEKLLMGYSGRMLVVMSVGTMSIMAGRLVISPLLPSIIEDLSITPFAAGIALSLMWALTATLQYFSGRSADELSRKTVLLTGLLVAVVGLSLLSTATSYPLFLLATATIGASAGIYPVAAYVQTTDLYVERRGAAFGVLSASMDLGGAVAPAIAVVVLTVWIWRGAFLPILAAVLVVMLLMHVWNREEYVVERVNLNIRETGTRILGKQSTRRILVAAGLVAFTWQGMASFLPTYLQVEKGFSPTVASVIFTGLFVVGATARPVSGRLGDRYGYLRISVLMALVGATGLVSLLVTESLLAAVASTALFGAGIAGFWPTTLTMISQVFPDGSMGGDFGGSRMMYVGFGSLGPAYIGYVAGELNYTVAFIGLIGCLLLSGTVIFWQLRFGSEV
ncbi:MULTISPECIES: MFS transporter [Haloarcula]|uniref:MFS transporter n=1 Tax=Haloarcula TaxID=2237 RepID=UPI0023EB0F26|nr:MFS transporter [Halomicroarcula sp. XH51]